MDADQLERDRLEYLRRLARGSLKDVADFIEVLRHRYGETRADELRVKWATSTILEYKPP